MGILIWSGAALSLLGLLGLIRCIVLATRAKREGLEGEEMQLRLQRVVVLNMASLGLAAIGLMMVVFGVFLS